MGSILGLEFHKNSYPEGFFVELSLDVSGVTALLSLVSPNSMELFRLWQIRRKVWKSAGGGRESLEFSSWSPKNGHGKAFPNFSGLGASLVDTGIAALPLNILIFQEFFIPGNV